MAIRCGRPRASHDRRADAALSGVITWAGASAAACWATAGVAGVVAAAVPAVSPRPTSVVTPAAMIRTVHRLLVVAVFMPLPSGGG
jgi:hypothetical protein